MASVFEELESLLGQPDKFSIEDFKKSIEQVLENQQRLVDLFNQNNKDKERLEVKFDTVVATVLSQYDVNIKMTPEMIQCLIDMGAKVKDIARIQDVSTNTIRHRLKK